MIQVINSALLPTAQREERYHFITHSGNITMLVSVIILLATIAIAYLMPEYFSIEVQVLTHVLMLLAATAIKIGYLLRCIGRYELGKPV